jgi:hypothetical protein
MSKKITNVESQPWGKLRQEKDEFKASLGYIVSSRPAWDTK